MATIEIPKVRKESTVIMYVSLTDNGVTVDWTSLSEIKPFMYSDEQHCIAGKCTAEIATGAPETLIVRYPTTAPQFLGQNSLLIRCTYDGNEKSFDVPVLEFVDRSSEATGVTVIEDPELPVAIEVQDVDTSVLDDAIAAALDAAAKATAAAELVPLDILAQCQAAAEAAEAAAENCAPVIGDNGNWWIYDYDAGEYVDSGKPSRGIQGEQGIQGIQGIQGNPGSSVDYPYELVNNRTTDDATKGLSAAEGKRLGDDLSQLDQEVTNLENGIPTYSWTDTPSTNSVIKELYLEGLKADKYYYFRYLCKGDGGADLMYIRECDDAAGTNPVLVVRCVDNDAKKGILQLEENNSSGISGYIIKNITSSAQWTTIESYINKAVASNIDYSPRIKEYLDNASLTSSLNSLDGDVDGIRDELDETIVRHINFLENLTTTTGKYYTHAAGTWSDGQLVAGYETKIPIKAGQTFYYRNLYAYFCGEMDKDSTWTPFTNDQSTSKDGSFTAVKDGEIRITVNTSVTATPLLTNSKDMYDDMIFTSYTTINAVTGAQKVFRVGSTREYTTLREGIAEAIKYPRSIVYVDAETFDLTTEFATEITAAGTAPYGILLENDVHIIFSAGAKVNALYSGNDTNVVTYFNPFHTLGGRGGFTLENLWLFCKNTRYCVHDEYNGADVLTRNRYINCHFEYDGTTSPLSYYQNCIGGGTAKHSYVEIRNCYFSSVGTMTERGIVSWHNASVADAQSRIIMSNCYFENGTFRLGYHGSSTLVSTAFLNNNSFTAQPFVRAETEGDTVENMEILGFLNEVRT